LYLGFEADGQPLRGVVGKVTNTREYVRLTGGYLLPPYDSEGIPCKYYIIAVDNEGYVTPFEIGRDARDRARFMWDRLIRAAHRCNMEGLDAGTEFWADHNGFFNY
jgi:hypothetical protein